MCWRIRANHTRIGANFPVAERGVGAENGIGFWVVILETDAQVVRFLLGEGEQNSALRYLDQSAREIGRLIPNHHSRDELPLMPMA